MKGRVVFAGGTGFIGTFLRGRLAQTYDVTLLTRHKETEAENLRIGRKGQRGEEEKGKWRGKIIIIIITIYSNNNNNNNNNNNH